MYPYDFGAAVVVGRATVIVVWPVFVSVNV